MSQPSVTTTELDGALGVLPPSAGKLLAVIGASSAGTINAPSTYARVKDLVAAFGYGHMVEAAAHAIERYGKPVVVVKTAATTAGASGSVTHVGTGTSVITVDTVATQPYDDYDAIVKVVTGGTVGTTGPVYQYSLDGGRNYSPRQNLGTANTFTIPNSGVTVDLAAGTLVAGDTYSFRTSAPLWSSTELSTAITALANWVGSWELCHIVGSIDATAFDAIELAFSAMDAAGKPHAWIGNTRMPNAGETEAAYKTALDTMFASKRSAKWGDFCAGAVKLVSSVTSGRKYRRPFSFLVAAREASVTEEVNIAAKTLGSFVGASIRDDNGNVDEHDESINPGLDDSGFTVARTWDDGAGVYVNRSRLFSAEGSDFQLLTHRRVMNLAKVVIRAYLILRLSRPVQVDKKTGFILESEAREIEEGGRAVLEAALLAKPKASAIDFVVNRNDNLLSTKTINTQTRVIPLAYPEYINNEIGFENPALQVVAV